MKRVIPIISIILLLSLCISGCSSDKPSLPHSEPATNPIAEPTTPSTLPSHVHSFNAATCTTPKACSVCGATEGNAAGHNWKNATCTALRYIILF